MSDNVNHPKHYVNHPSGVECIQITEHMGFNLGNAVKYIWRCDLKKDCIEDLKKAAWYLNREIKKREQERINQTNHIKGASCSIVASEEDGANVARSSKSPCN